MSDIRNDNIKLLMRDISRLSKENAALKAVVEKFTSTNSVRDAICPKCGIDTSTSEQTVLRSCGGCGLTYAVKRHP